MPTTAPLSSPLAAPQVTPETLSPSPTSASPSPAAGPSSTETSVLDPSQVLALQSLGLVAGPNVCTSQPTQIQCDNGVPVRHLTLLGLQYCPPGATLSEAALANLSTLTSLSFLNCPASAIVPWPPALALSLTSFTVSASLGQTVDHPELEALPGWWIGRLHNLQQLTVLDVMLNASSADVILSNMTRLTELTIQNADLSGTFPETWPATNLTTLDLSNNRLVGSLSPNISTLAQLTQLNLELNVMSGSLPEALGELGNLNKLKLNGNLFSGSVPASIANLTNLVYLDLSNNRFNGSVPAFIGDLSGLRYLDLSNNSFQGPIPFSPLFLSQLNTFQATGNKQLCYNATSLAAKLAGGLPACDSNGLPNVVDSAPNAFAPAAPPKAQPGHSVTHAHHKGPSTLVWAAGIGVGVVVFLIVVIVVVSRCCNSGKD